MSPQRAAHGSKENGGEGKGSNSNRPRATPLFSPALPPVYVALKYTPVPPSGKFTFWTYTRKRLPRESTFEGDQKSLSLTASFSSVTQPRPKLEPKAGRAPRGHKETCEKQLLVVNNAKALNTDRRMCIGVADTIRCYIKIILWYCFFNQITVSSVPL